MLMIFYKKIVKLNIVWLSKKKALSLGMEVVCATIIPPLLNYRETHRPARERREMKR
jgi:hypothetical protein